VQEKCIVLNSPFSEFLPREMSFRRPHSRNSRGKVHSDISRGENHILIENGASYAGLSSRLTPSRESLPFNAILFTGK